MREDVIFFSQHGPFPAYLKRFHLSDSDYCSCGGIGTALHYATECIYTVSWCLYFILERMLSSSLNMDLSLPTSKGFTCLTAITAVVVELARHFTMPRSVFIQCLG
ncbi:hypothetical protein AVEN_164639-1, partial [Araneus ventricosus]